MDKFLNDNWSELGKKVSEHVPDEFSPKDWEVMDKMLDGIPAANGNKKNGHLFLKGFAVGLVLVVATLFIFLNGGEKTDEHSGVALVEENLNVEINDKNELTETVELEKNNAENNLENTEINSGENILNNGEINNLNKNKGLDAVAVGGDLLNQNENENENEKIDGGVNEKGREEGGLGENNLNENKNEVAGVAELDNLSGGEHAFAELEPMVHLSFLGLEELEINTEILTADFDYNLPINNKFSRKIRFGALLGVNNTVTSYDSMATSHLPYFGLFANKRITEKLEIQVEAHVKFVDNYDVLQEWTNNLYSALGPAGTERVRRYYHKYNSLDIPVVLKYSSSNRLGLLAGARFSYLGLAQIGLHVVSNASGAESFGPKTPEYGFWKYDLNLVLGAEYYMSPRWLIDFRLNQGFLDITPDNLYKDDAVHLNSDLQFSLRYIF